MCRTAVGDATLQKRVFNLRRFILAFLASLLNPYTAERRDVSENTPPEAQEISQRRGFCTLRSNAPGVQSPCSREISRSKGDVFPKSSRVEAVYDHSFIINQSLGIQQKIHLKRQIKSLAHRGTYFPIHPSSQKCMDTRTIPRMSVQVIEPLLTSIVATLTWSELLSTISGWEIGRIPLDVLKMKLLSVILHIFSKGDIS